MITIPSALITDADRATLARVRDAGPDGLAVVGLAALVRRAVDRLAAAGLVAVAVGVATAVPAAAPPPDALVFVAVRVPASLVRRLDAVVGRRRASAAVNPPTRSTIVRGALARALDAADGEVTP